MRIKTEEKIKKLEKEVAALWQILDDERLWDPSIIREIKNRSKSAAQAYRKKRLKEADEVFAPR